MYVCICKGITEQQIIDEINKAPAHSSKDIVKRLGLGSDCGTCLIDAIDKLFNTTKQSSAYQIQSTANKQTN
jgi:bacterioferritin-associated ferredoxin